MITRSVSVAERLEAPPEVYRPPAGYYSPPAQRRSFGLPDLIIGVMVAAILVMSAGVYFFERYDIASESMDPTLEVGETVWAVRLYTPPERGDVIAFVNPMAPDSDEIVIKRVVGMPGERVEAYDGVVHANYGPLNEGVWVDAPAPTEDFGPFELGDGEYFMMGDNRSRSADSRMFGPVPRSALLYRVVSGLD